MVLHEMGKRARAAAKSLALLESEQKNRLLSDLAGRLEKRSSRFWQPTRRMWKMEGAPV